MMMMMKMMMRPKTTTIMMMVDKDGDGSKLNPHSFVRNIWQMYLYLVYPKKIAS